MLEHKVTTAVVIQWLGWAVAFLLVLADMVMPTNTGELGLLIGGGAGVMQIKGFIVDEHKHEQEAFELGVEASDHVRPLHPPSG